MKWCISIITLFFITTLIHVPLVNATPLIEVFADETFTSSEILSEEFLDSVEQGELELIVWHSNENSSLHISAASERAGDLNANIGDVFIQGISLNSSNGSIPTDLNSIYITMDIQVSNNGLISLQANTTLSEELAPTVVLQWLLLKKEVAISEHPLGPRESKVVSYHAWDSNINRTAGAENNWIHQIDMETLESWNLKNTELIASVSLVSLDSNEIFGTKSIEIPNLIDSENNSKDLAISLLLLIAGLAGCVITVLSERRRQMDMPKIRPMIQWKDERCDYFIEINTGNASITISSIGGNGYWKFPEKELPLKIGSNSTKEIKIRKTAKINSEPCTIRLNVDGHDRWVLDLEFPETDST